MLPRVRYNKSPLVEVVFQLRFPTILSINASQPVDFQEKIRKDYPYFEEILEEQNELNIQPAEMKAHLRRIAGIKNYAFVSTDRTFKINLTASFIAFSTMAYTQWEDFSAEIKKLLALFEETYHPAFYTRIGLRYVDIITKSRWELEDRAWHELIKPHVLGVVTPDREEGTSSFISESEYAEVGSEYIQKSHIEFVHVNDSKEISLLIDCDYFTNRETMLSETWVKAECLHKNSNSFIANAITEILNDAMEPETIE